MKSLAATYTMEEPRRKVHTLIKIATIAHSCSQASTRSKNHYTYTIEKQILAKAEDQRSSRTLNAISRKSRFLHVSYLKICRKFIF